MNILKQSTAATIKIGPFVDDTDGKTAETALTIGQADIRLSKNGGDIAQTNNATGATHDELGYYDIPLDTTDTGTLGRLRVLVSKAGALPVWQDFVVVTANVYDSMFSTDKLDVAVVEMATDVLTAAAVKADAVTKIQNGLATQIDLEDAAPVAWLQDGSIKATTFATDAIAAAAVKADAVTKIQNGLASSSDLAVVDSNVDAILADTGTDGVVLASTQGAITWGQQKIIADVSAEGALDIRNSHSQGIGLFNSGNIAQFNAGGSVGVVNDGAVAVMGFDPAIATASNLQTVDDIVDTIKTQTDKIPASPASAGEYTTNIGAIKAKTDNLPLSPASSGEYTSALTAIQNDLDNPNQYKADVSNLALQATSLAIKGQTDKIPAAPAQTGEYNAALTAIQADLDNPTQYKADVSALMLASSYVAPNNAGITAIKAKTDNLPANTATALAAIQADLDNPAQYKADVSGLATTAHVQEVENKIDAIDVTVNTIPTNPLLDTAYTAPDNAGIAAIQEKTEQLTFTAPNKVDASATVDPTGIATSEELDIIGEKVDGVLNKLNVSSVEFVTAVVGSNITILRGDTLAARLLDLGDLTQYASLDFTVKRVAGELDDAAKIRLRKNASGTDDGLLRINGAEYATATDGSIVIDDLTTGDIEIKLNAAATRELVPGNYVYDVQLIIANEVRTLTAGKLEVVADVTRAVA